MIGDRRRLENVGFFEEAQDGRQQQPGGAAAAVRMDAGAVETPQGEGRGSSGGGSVGGCLGREGGFSNQVFT